MTGKCYNRETSVWSCRFEMKPRGLHTNIHDWYVSCMYISIERALQIPTSDGIFLVRLRDGMKQYKLLPDLRKTEISSLPDGAVTYFISARELPYS